MISVVMINTRGKVKPEWLNLAINSVKKQLVDCELIVINNLDRAKSIGYCWNEGVKAAQGDWVFFLGDDDYISDDYLFSLSHLAGKTKSVMVTSYMTVFRDDMDKAYPYTQPCTGMYRKDYLLQYPFNETLERGIDREYIDKLKLRGDTFTIAQHNYGYFYRKHNELSCAGDIRFIDDVDTYIITKYPAFIQPIADRLKNVYISNVFEPEIADQAKVIFCDFATENAVEIANYDCKARKILRVHSFDAYANAIKYVDFSKYDKVIFVSKHIERYVKIRTDFESIVIPNGVDLKKFPEQNKTRNNKIAYVGHISRVKGIGELLLIAKSLPEYEFHIAGKFQEDDVAQYLAEKLPDNVFLNSWQYDLAEFYKDKTFILNTSVRESQGMVILEGMASGLKPIINDWIGAADIYGEEFIYKNIYDIGNILAGSYEPERYREFVKDNYDFEKIYPLIKDIIIQADNDIHRTFEQVRNFT